MNLLVPIPFLSLTPQHDPIQRTVLNAITEVYSKNWFVLGDAVKNFEQEYAQFSHTRFCVGVGNGFDALCLALRACGIGKGDEVIVPANTCIATWLAITHVGASIVPVEPDPATYILDINQIDSVITSRTKAIMPVHLYGQPCDLSALQALATAKSLFLIEDNAQAQGALWMGKPTGSVGHINATSFYPTKNLGALGDGGAITTNDEVLAHAVQRDRNYGSTKKNVFESCGINSRLDEIQAAVLRVKLQHLHHWNNQRMELATQYISQLAGVGDLQLPQAQAGARHVYHLFVVRTAQRDKLQQYLLKHAIETLIHYPVPPHLQPAYSNAGFKRGEFPITEQLAEQLVSLPLWPGMTTDQVNSVCETIKTFFGSGLH